MNASCHNATDCKLLTLPGIAATYTLLLNICDTVLESNKQRVYTNTHATAKHQIQLAGSPMPAMVISMKAARDHNSSPLDYLTSKVAHEEPEIRRADANILIDNNCTHTERHSGLPGSQWFRWRMRWARCHSHRLPAMTGHDWPQDVLPGNRWCRQIRGRGWWWCGCTCGGRSIVSRWWINAEFGGLRASY